MIKYIINKIKEWFTLNQNKTNNFFNRWKSPSERSMFELRTKRNKLLAETDFYALSDVTMTEAMTNYRQQLRDITNGLSTVEEVEAVEFPTKP